MNLQAQILAVLNDDRIDDETVDDTCYDLLGDLITEYSWEAVQAVLIELLRDDSQTTHWQTIAEVFWEATLDQNNLPEDELIALLYHRLVTDSASEDNLVWSIASKLKGVDYLSEYDPLRDPAVLHELEKIQSGTEQAQEGI